MVILEMSTDTTDWLQRRVSYSASLASTSRSAYVLGIGDRNPQQMLMRSTGEIVHTEFTEWFDAARERISPRLFRSG
jgi:FKBP12-rapamycin complex-associated protein